MSYFVHKSLNTWNTAPTLDKMLEVEFWSQIFFNTLKLLVQNDYFSPKSYTTSFSLWKHIWVLILLHCYIRDF